MTIKFSVIGNQEDMKGNPIPYHRATQGSKWNPAHQRYLKWKDYVTAAFRNAAPTSPFCVFDNLVPHPVLGNPHGSVHVSICFGSENHADPDNIVKGILDALFKNDKEIDVHTSHTCGNSDPKVDVSIEISKPK
jgi:hypothetical protein